MLVLKTCTLTEALGENFKRALIVASPAAVECLRMNVVAASDLDVLTFKEGKNIAVLKSNAGSITQLQDCANYTNGYSAFDTVHFIYVLGGQLTGIRHHDANGLALNEQYIIDNMIDLSELKKSNVAKPIELLSHVYDGLKEKKHVIVVISEAAAERLGIKDKVNMSWPEDQTNKIVFVDKCCTQIPRRSIFEADALFEIATDNENLVCTTKRIKHANENAKYGAGWSVVIDKVDLERLPNLAVAPVVQYASLRAGELAVPAFKVSLNTLLDAVNSTLIVADVGANKYLKSEYGFYNDGGDVLRLCFEDNSPTDAVGRPRFVDVLPADELKMEDILNMINYVFFEDFQKYRQIFYIESVSGVLRTRHIRFKPGMFPPAFELITESNQLEVDFPKK